MHASMWSLVLIADRVPSEAVVSTNLYFFDFSQARARNQTFPNPKYSPEGEKVLEVVDTNFPHTIDQTMV